MTTYENEIRRRSWLSEETRRSLRHSLVLLGLIPLTVLLATRLNHLLGDPLLGIYAIVGLTATTTVMYLAFARYRDPSGAAAFGDDPPLVTCLVAVKNEADVIERCVRSLVGSSYPRLEVVVVDDGSTDGTLEQLGELRDELGFNLIAMPESAGKKRALTCGATTAHGDFLVFTDSDCVLAEDAVERAISALVADPELGAVSGHARALNADTSFLTKVQDTWYEGQFSVWKAAESFLGAVTCISGPLAAFRREAIFNYLPAWENDRFLGREFRFATDRQLTGYVLGGKFVGPTAQGDSTRTRRSSRTDDYPARNWKIGVRQVGPCARRLSRRRSAKLVRQQVRWKKSFLRNLCFTGTVLLAEGPSARLPLLLARRCSS